MKKYLILLIVPIIVGFTIVENCKTKNVTSEKPLYFGQRIIRASEYLLQKKNADNNYSDGNQHELYQFIHEDTDHTDSQVDYRYIGRKANNYVYFNCIGDDISTCEIWRIIGVFPTQSDKGDTKYRLKIIRNQSIGQDVFDDSDNDFVNSLLQKYLNNEYYNNLSYISKKMIGLSKYYISGDSTNYYNGEIFYKSERGSNTNKSVDFIGNVGLIYPSDYLYTYSGINDNCYSSLGNCASNKDSWMYNMIKQPLWTITQVVNTNKVYVIGDSDNHISYESNKSLDVYPVVYLNYDIVIESGEGSKINPYYIRPMYDSEIQSEMEMLQSIEGLDKSNVNVGDTLSTKSLLLIITSIILVLGGILIIVKMTIEKKKNSLK